MRHPKKKTLAQVAACSEGSNQIELPLDISTPLISVRYPNADTVAAIPLAIMLKGREVSTPDTTFKFKATRLPAYIFTLSELGLGESIIAAQLPYTKFQLTKKHKRPFAKYYLLPSLILQEGERAQVWADKIIAENNLCIEDFPISKLWQAHLRGEV